MTRVVFLCVGNMCRSQMAEGLARYAGGGLLAVESAGTRPSGVVSREASKVLAELGIDISGQWSKGLDEVDLAGADVIISMAPEPARALVPRDFEGIAQDWDVPDPVGQPVESFRIIRQELAERIEALVEDLGIEPTPLPAPGEIRYGDNRPLGRDR